MASMMIFNLQPLHMRLKAPPPPSRGAAQTVHYGLHALRTIRGHFNIAVSMFIFR